MVAELGGSHDVIMEASPVNEHQSNGVVERAVQTVGGMIRTHKLALEQSFSKELEADHVVIPWLIMHAAVRFSLFELCSDRRTAPIFGECVFDFPLDRARGRANKLEASVSQCRLCRTEFGSQRDVHRHCDGCGQSRCDQAKRQRQNVLSGTC